MYVGFVENVYVPCVMPIVDLYLKFLVAVMYLCMDRYLIGV